MTTDGTRAEEARAPRAVCFQDTGELAGWACSTCGVIYMLKKHPHAEAIARICCTPNCVRCGAEKPTSWSLCDDCRTLETKPDDVDTGPKSTGGTTPPVSV
jgi:hypothetical protein